MRLLIELEMENAAFEGITRHGEAARILHKLANNIASGYLNLNGPDSLRLLDINGNTCGSASTKDNAEVQP